MKNIISDQRIKKLEDVSGRLAFLTMIILWFCLFRVSRVSSADVQWYLQAAADAAAGAFGYMVINSRMVAESKYYKAIQLSLFVIISCICIVPAVAVTGMEQSVFGVAVPVRNLYSNYGTIAEVKTAAAAGDSAAQVDLGLMYIDGATVAVDYVQAAHWLDLAIVDLKDRAEQETKLNSAYSGTSGLLRTANNAWLALWPKLNTAQWKEAAAWSQKVCADHYHHECPEPLPLK